MFGDSIDDIVRKSVEHTLDLLDTSAAKHKLAIRPKRKYTGSKRQRQIIWTDFDLSDESTTNTVTEEEDTSVKDTIIKDTTIKDTTAKDTTINDTTIEDTIIKDTTIKDAIIKDTTIKDTTKDTSVKDTTIKETTIKDTTEDKWLCKRRLGLGKNTTAADLLKKMKEGAVDEKDVDPRFMRDTLIRGLIDSEISFAQEMMEYVEKYIKVIEEGGPKVPDRVKDNVDKIFLNFRKIAEFHSTYMVEGVKYYQREPKQMGKGFLRLEKDFDMHVNYCGELNGAIEFLYDMANRDILDYFAGLQKEYKDEKSIKDILNTPVERLGDYVFLLKELGKYTELLKESPVDTLRAAEFINGIPEKSEVIKYTGSLENYRGNLNKLGRLLRHGWYKITDNDKNTKERYCFLYKSRILITKVEKQYGGCDTFELRHSVKLPETVLEEDVEPNYSFRLTHKKPDRNQRYPIFLTAKTAALRDDWVEQIKTFATDPVTQYENDLDDIILVEPDDYLIKKAEKTRVVEEEPDVDYNIKSCSDPTALAKLAANSDDVNCPPTAPTIENCPRMDGTIEPQVVKPGETATFECSVMPDEGAASVTWFKDNKLLDDALQDRISVTSEDEHTRFRLTLLNCTETDSGLYTAQICNDKGSSTCSSYLLVKGELTEEEQEKLKEKGAKFVIKPHDVCALEDTYLRLMLEVQGDPKPLIKFYKDNKQIPFEHPRWKIFHPVQDSNQWELIILRVQKEDEGVYKAVARNCNGEDTCEATVTLQEHPKSPLREDASAEFNWARNGLPMEKDERFQVLFKDDEDSLALFFHHVTPEDAGFYTCVAQTAKGKMQCSAELTVMGTVRQLNEEPLLPVVENTGPKFSEVTEGSSACLELKVHGYPRPNVTWTHDGAAIPGDKDRYSFFHKEDNETVALVIKDVEGDDSGRYSVIARNELGEAEVEIELLVKAAPKIKTKLEDRKALTEEVLVVEIDIEGSPAPTATWFRNGKPIELGGRFKVASFGKKRQLIIEDSIMEDTGNYSVTVANCVSETSASFHMAVNAKPKFVQALPSQVILNDGETLTLTCEILSSPPGPIKWFMCKTNRDLEEKIFNWETDGVEIKNDPKRKNLIIQQSGDIHTLIATGMTRNDMCCFRCTAGNDFGTSISDCELFVNCKPVITKKFEDKTIVEGDANEALTVQVEAYPDPTIKWYVNDVEIDENRSEYSLSEAYGKWTLTLLNVEYDLNGVYKCVVTNEHGSAEVSATYLVKSPPKFLQELPVATGTDEAQNLTLTVKIQAYPDPSVKWLFNKHEIQPDPRLKITRDKDVYSLTITGLKKCDEGDYLVKAHNEQGEASSPGVVQINSVKTTKKTTKTTTTKTTDEIVEEEIIENKTIEIKKDETDENKQDEKNKEDEKIEQNKIIETKTKTEIKQDEVIEIKQDEIIETTQDEKPESKQNELIKAKQDEDKEDKKEEKIENKELEQVKTNKTKETDVSNKTKKQQAQRSLSTNDCETNKLNKENIRKHSVDSAVTQSKTNTDTIPIQKSEISEIRESNENIDTKPTEKILEQIPEQKQQEEKDAFPTINCTSMKDRELYESLGCLWEVQADGMPRPTAKWFFNDQEVVNDANNEHVVIGDVEKSYTYKIVDATLDQAGKYKCVISNRLGEKTVEANLSMQPVGELRKPKILRPFKDEVCRESEAGKFQCTLTADPIPDFKWFIGDLELMPCCGVYDVKIEHKEVEDGLKKCVCSFSFSDAKPEHNGTFKMIAENLHGVAESSARLDVFYTPFAHEMRDFTIVPSENATLETVITANPPPTITWSRDGVLIEDNEHTKMVVDAEANLYKLVLTDILKSDAGTYTITAKNLQGETSKSCEVKVHTEKPEFILPLESQHVKACHNADFRVRVIGVPKPQLKWFKNGEPIEIEGRLKIDFDNLVSILTIENFQEEDEGSYSVVAENVAGETTCTAELRMSEIPPGFLYQPERNYEVFEDEELHLKYKLDGSPLPTVDIFKDGEPFVETKRIKISVSDDGIVELLIPSALPSDSGAYKLVAKNRWGEKPILTAVTVNPLPRPPKFLAPLSDGQGKGLCAYKMLAKVRGFPAPTISWIKDGHPLRHGKHLNFINNPGGIVGLEFTSLANSDAGRYTAVAFNRLGEVKSSCHFKVEEADKAPGFACKLTNVNAIEGFPCKLHVKTFGYPAPKFEWQFKGQKLKMDGVAYSELHAADGETCLLIHDAQQSFAGTYKCIAYNNLGEVECKGNLEVIMKDRIILKKEPPAFVHHIKDVTADEASNITVDVAFTGNPIPDVKWLKNDLPLNIGNRAVTSCDGKRMIFELLHVELSDAAKYSCVLTNTQGEESTDFNIAVRKIYDAPQFVHPLMDVGQLINHDAKFTVKLSGLPTPEVKWYKKGKDEPLTSGAKYLMNREGDEYTLTVLNIGEDDETKYTCIAKNKLGEASQYANLKIVEIVVPQNRVEPAKLLKKLQDCEVFKGMTAKFTACMTGEPEPEIIWYRDGCKVFPDERVKIEKDSTGLLRLIVEKATEMDEGKYKIRIFNQYGHDESDAQLIYDNLDNNKKTRTKDHGKYRETGSPIPLADRPIISCMTDRHLTLSWRPSLPKGPREPVTYRIEMQEIPGDDWKTIRTGIRSCACEISNLIPCIDYKLRVRVENKWGISDPSPFVKTQRDKLIAPVKVTPYFDPYTDFRPESHLYFPKDYDIFRPSLDGMAEPPKFLGDIMDNQYGIKNHNSQLVWYVYGYPRPKMTYYFGDELIEMGGRFDSSYTRNGQATLFVNKMLERDVGVYEAVARNEHGEARKRVFLNLGEIPRFIHRPDETHIMLRKNGTIETRIYGVPLPEIKWYKDWSPLAPSSRIKMFFIEPDRAILSIHEAMERDEGLYSCVLSNIVGQASLSVSLRIDIDESEYAYNTYTGRLARERKPAKHRNFKDYYDLGDELGRGTQGITYHAVERGTGRSYAAKIMHGKGDLKAYMLNELEMYNIVNHRKLLRLHDVFETDRSIILVLELASGGELLDVLTREDFITESMIARYIRQVLWGLDHMHSQNLGHLGLTLGDLLISHYGGDDLKIADLGLARRIHHGKLLPTIYGMPEFSSPETVGGKDIRVSSDMWSLGIITLILLTGHSPFRGENDRETISRVISGKWDEGVISGLSFECQDFIKLLLTYQEENRMDVKTALKHPWLLTADKSYEEETEISTISLRRYYRELKDWYSNSSCRTWYRRNPFDTANTDPSCMIYPPGFVFTPAPSPPPRTPEPRSYLDDLKEREPIDIDFGAFSSESHYQYGPDTYLLQLRDVDFPCRIRNYLKVAYNRSPGYAFNDTRDWRAPVIKERRRFTDVMDEEIDDERRARINKYEIGNTYTVRRLRRELGPRMEGQVEADAIVESRRDGYPPFLREKPQILPIVADKPAQLSCLAVGEPKPIIQWFKNDNLVSDGRRVKITEDKDGRSILQFDTAMLSDAGIYKVVARNRLGQTVARTRVVLASNPSAPDSPEASDIGDTEVLLRWKQPKDDGNSTVVCYSLQYKEADQLEWTKLADNIDHEYYLVRNLKPSTAYIFRLAARNKIGWSEFGIPSENARTKDVGTAKVTTCTRAMMHLQQITDSGQPVAGLEAEELLPPVDYSIEKEPIEMKNESPTEKYNFISEISMGRFSSVAKAIEKESDRVVVVKVLTWSEETAMDVQREFEAWRSLRHERICSLYDVYKFDTTVTFILEKLQGSDVLTYLASRHEYTEQMVCYIISQIIDALQYLHWRGICHLAIEPDNIVMAGVRSAQVKLVDFGASQRVSKLGTGVPPSFATEFSAPEVLLCEPAYPQSDIWSVGILTYLLLSGVSPFRAETVDETRQNISFVRYRFEHLYKELTPEATRFIMLLFKRAPSKRPTAEECHEHRWLLPTEHMIKKRERAVFLGNRLKDFNEKYHSEKAKAAEMKSKGPAIAKLSRSISVQEELLTPCS